MRGSLGQPVVVENITGASGTIRRRPRGSPLRLTVTRSCSAIWATHVLNGPMFSLQYDLVKDFEPVRAGVQRSADDRRKESPPGNRT
jgi:tripartite-type tricarboxylate transporter receptor subunit TctC